MNSRKALKAAAKHIENMEYSIARYVIDVKAYNECILAMIKGESPCPYCEDHEECQLAAKDGKGCENWYLKDIPPVAEEGSEDDAGEGDKGSSGSEGILFEGATGRERA